MLQFFHQHKKAAFIRRHANMSKLMRHSKILVAMNNSEAGLMNHCKAKIETATRRHPKGHADKPNGMLLVDMALFRQPEKSWPPHASAGMTKCVPPADM